MINDFIIFKKFAPKRTINIFSDYCVFKTTVIKCVVQNVLMSTKLKQTQVLKILFKNILKSISFLKTDNQL